MMTIIGPNFQKRRYNPKDDNVVLLWDESVGDRQQPQNWGRPNWAARLLDERNVRLRYPHYRQANKRSIEI